MEKTFAKSHSLIEFMEVENQIKQGTLNGSNVFVGESFRRDDLGDSVGTELTELLDGKRGDDSILREE